MTAWIRTRKHASGKKTYQVLYRIGGRAYRQETAGSFKTKAEADKRLTIVAGWLALGKNPKAELAVLQAEPPRRETLSNAFDRMIRSRHDVAENTILGYGTARRPAEEFFGPARDPFTITVPNCREYVGWLAEKGLEPSSVRSYWQPFAQVFDFLEIEPNPARNRTVKLPALGDKRYTVMTRAEFHLMRGKLAAKYDLFARVLEATAMRVSELYWLQWGDLDFAGGRFRIFKTKGRTGGRRWCPVPAALMDEIDGLLPLEDRSPDRRVFHRVPSAEAARTGMERACLLAGIPHYSPHDLRKRRASLWHAQLVPERVVMEWGGWKSASTLREVYTHVILDAKDDDWLGEARARLNDMAGHTLSSTQEEVQGGV